VRRAVVVGGGLAGACAARVLAARGVATTLVRAGPGATALCAGSVDVAGASPDPAGLPWRDPVRAEPLSPAERLAFALHSRPAHPYGVLFPERDGARAAAAVKEAAAELDAWLRPSGLGVEGGLDATRLLAGVRGAVRVADLARSEVAVGDLGRAERVVLVDWPGLAGYDARAAARMLAADLAALGLLPRPVRVERPALPEPWLDAGARPAALAARLDDPAAGAELAAALRGLGGPGTALLLPPILGLDRTGALLGELRAAAGGPVAELLGAPPWSPAGPRLDRALLAGLEAAGVAVVTARVRRLELAAGRVRAVELEEEAQPLPADAVVLATGRFVGGGIREREDRLEEPLLGLPLYDTAGRRVDATPPRRQVDPDPARPQPLFAAGVRTDGRLRPLGPDARPAAANLVAAGDLVGGFDPAVQRTGLGFALLSGLRAGEEAARLAEEPSGAPPTFPGATPS